VGFPGLSAPDPDHTVSTGPESQGGTLMIGSRHGRKMVDMNSKNRRLTPSLLISILALFVAIGGTSYAAVKINGKDIKKGTVAGKALKKNTVTGAKVKESSLGQVPNAKLAESATTAGSAATAADAEKLNGKTADELASPAAYALIIKSGGELEIPAAEAHGIGAANVTEVGGGIVCISGLSFEPKLIQATTYRAGGGTSNSVPNVNAEEPNFCAAGAQAEIQMVNGATSAPDTNPRFYVALYR